MWQARFVARALAGLGLTAQLVEVATQGDHDQRPFSQISGSGFFTKAVQRAVQAGAADIAVHSYKDLPSAAAPGLVMACVPQRADARDVLLLRPECWAKDGGSLPLKAGCVVGTSAARRREQLLALRPDLRTAELRGNVPTRVAKLREGRFDAILIARAGLDRLRLDLPGLLAVTLPPSLLSPAPAQGALAVEARSDDVELLAHLARLDDRPVRRTVAAERELMALFDAGCQLALGAHATLVVGGEIELSAWFAGRHVTASHADPVVAACLAHAALVRHDGEEPAGTAEKAASASVGATHRSAER